MGLVSRLVCLEPFALRQAKYGHCAAQQFCSTFAQRVNAAAIMGGGGKQLVF
jgi:hypothetical protein